MRMMIRLIRPIRFWRRFLIFAFFCDTNREKNQMNFMQPLLPSTVAFDHITNTFSDHNSIVWFYTSSLKGKIQSVFSVE